MKRPVYRQDLVYKIFVPATIAALLLLHFIAPYLHWIYSLHWLTLLVLLNLVVRETISAKTQLLTKRATQLTYTNSHNSGNSTESLPQTNPALLTQSWIIRIIGFELLLMLSFCALYALAHDYVPVVTHQTPSTLLQSLHSFLIQDGLFPWGIIALLSLCYRQSQTTAATPSSSKDCFFIDALHPLLHDGPTGPVGIVMQNFLTHATIIWLNSLCITFVFTVYYLLALSTHQPIVAGPNFAAIISVIVVFFAYRQGARPTHIRRLFAKSHPLWLSLFVILAIIAIVLITISTFFYALPEFHLRNPSRTYQLIAKTNWPLYWQLFEYLWWLCSIPASALFLAICCRGQPLVKSLCVMLALPIFLAVCCYFLPASLLQKNWHVELLHPFIVCILLLSVVGLGGLLLRWQVLPMYALNYLPAQWPPKTRSLQKWLQRFLAFLAVGIYFYLPGGIVILSYFLNSCLSLPLILIYGCVLANGVKR